MTDDKKPRERPEAETASPESAPESAPEPARGPSREPGGESEGRGQSQWARSREATSGAEAEEAPAEAESDPAARIAELEAEKAELREQLLRALADVENTRRRLQRELEEKLKYATAPLAKDILGVADNLGRALGAVPEEVREQEAVKSLIAGVEMTEKSLLEAFAKHGIERIDPFGQKLDPHRHEAMMEIQDPSKPSGTVAQVFEAGYELRGRLLRPARVAVAKGGPAGNGGEAAEPGSTVDTKA
ncbi:MAG: nucleotide exchange factor GrpE [Tistlia sp.]|uniref:nucleotide exchange factor GrpE n=1 Tax=Tistlia sp. TaxID=3057121 RepID=UPI0034A2E052